VIGPVLACNELEVQRAAVLCYANHVNCFGSTLIPIDIIMYVGFEVLIVLAMKL
jgi:hypothetical protein